MSISNRLQNRGKNTYFLGIFLLLVSLLFTLLFVSPSAHAAPTRINYQGRLTNSSGTPMPDGQYNMTFRIYDAASGGTLLWSETRETTNRVTVTNGQFQVRLGDVSAVTGTVFASNSTYFEVELPTPATATCSTASCGSYTEGAMTPRQAISSAAYALQASNSLNLGGYSSGSFFRLDANNSISGGNTFSGLNTFNSSTTTVSGADSTTKFRIRNNTNADLFNADTTNMIVKLDTYGAASLANVRLMTTNAEFTGTVRVGSATNGVDISGANGILLSGTARRTTSMLLTPEYANAVLDAGSGSNNTGSMTARLDLTNRRNYYKWTTSSGTAQSYDVVVQVPIPSDFSAWATTTPITIDTYTSDTTNGTVTIEARDTAGVVVSGINFASVTPTAATAWQTRSAGTISGTFTAGGYMTLRIRMASPTSGDVRISNIKLDYLSKW